MRRYRGRYVIVAVVFVLELPVWAALTLGALVTRVLVAVVSLARRARG